MWGDEPTASVSVPWNQHSLACHVGLNVQTQISFSYEVGKRQDLNTVAVSYDFGTSEKWSLKLMRYTGRWLY